MHTIAFNRNSSGCACGNQTLTYLEPLIAEKFTEAMLTTEAPLRSVRIARIIFAIEVRTCVKCRARVLLHLFRKSKCRIDATDENSDLVARQILSIGKYLMSVKPTLKAIV